MRQAVTTIFAALCVASSPVTAASNLGTDAAAAIAQARRLIDANDYAPAMDLLEDLLPDADAADTPVILGLLRQAYEALARDAKAAGRDREAAYFQDNLAIIARAPGNPAQVRPGEQKPQKAVSLEPATSGIQPSERTKSPQSVAPARNIAFVGATQDATPAPAPPPEPAPLSESAKTPAPEPLPLSPRQIAASDPASMSLRGPGAQKKNDAARDASNTTGKAPGSAGAVDLNSPTSTGDPGASVQANDPKPSMDGPTLEEGDRFFAAQKYGDARRCYAALARQNRLPPHRVQHWAYCRMVEVVRRINLRPRSAREWDEIEAEIVSIQRLSPNIWYGEYLRNKVAEVRRGGRRPLSRSDNLVVRGTAPDDSQGQPESPSRRFPHLFGNSRGASVANAQQPPPATPPAASPDVLLKLPDDSSPSRAPATGDRGQAGDRDLADNGRGTPTPVVPAPADPTPAAQAPATQDAGVVPAPDNSASAAWQVYETVNFRIYHRDARLAESAGQAAEAVRAAQAKRWASPAGQKPWTPACEIYLYPSGKVFARETKQPEESPGFSTMECNGNRVVARRVNLRADHPQVVAAILPHEVTHVVLADLFTSQQIPRWADEGLAVLAEPRTEQQTRAAELEEPLESGRVFDLSKLMAMDYPDPKDWSLYYAQSVSLTRFLVEQARPEQFIQFVQASQRDGVESALRGTYRIAGLADLQARWTEFARQQVQPVREASRDPRSQPAEVGVK